MKLSIISQIFPNYNTICIPYNNEQQGYSLAIQYSKSLNQGRVVFLGKENPSCMYYAELVNRVVPFLQDDSNGTQQERVSNAIYIAFAAVESLYSSSKAKRESLFQSLKKR